MEGKGVYFQVLAPGKTGTQVSKPISPAQCRQRFHKEGEGTEQGDQGRGVQSSLHAEQHRPVQ